MSPSHVICFSFLRQSDLGGRCLLRLLLKGVRQHHQLASKEESQYPEGVPSNVNTDFPDIVRIDQFLEVIGRHTFQIPNHTQHPSHLLNGLVRQFIEMILHRAMPRRGGVEPDLFHLQQVNIFVNLVNYFL